MFRLKICKHNQKINKQNEHLWINNAFSSSWQPRDTLHLPMLFADGSDNVIAQPHSRRPTMDCRILNQRSFACVAESLSLAQINKVIHGYNDVVFWVDMYKKAHVSLPSCKHSGNTRDFYQSPSFPSLFSFPCNVCQLRKFSFYRISK